MRKALLFFCCLLACPAGFAQRYHDYSSTLALVNDYAQRYPTIFKKVGYGRSVAGRELYAVKISDRVSVNEAEPEIAIDGGTHGEEVISGEVAVRLIIDLVEGYATDEEITELVDSREIWIYPYLNPDGRQRTTRYNNNRIDLNRDYGYLWDGSSPFPFSQPETRAARSWIDGRHFVFSLHYHAGFEAAFFPWGYTSRPGPDYDALARLAQVYRDASGSTLMRSGQANTAMYPTKGTYYDYVYGTRGTLAWLIEVSRYKYPSSGYIPTVYRRQRAAALALMRYAGDGVTGSVRDAQTGAAVAAALWLSRDGDEYWPVYSDPQVGDFHKYLAPGVYRLRAEANGYRTRLIDGLRVPDGGGAVDVDVRLTPEDAAPAYALRVEMARVPTFNDADENMTPWALHAADGRRFSLDRDGWVVLDLGRAIGSDTGPALRVIEDDSDPEAYRVQVSGGALGPYVEIGSGVGTQTFDLAEIEKTAFRYVKVIDSGHGVSDVADAGFDLDAVAAYRAATGSASVRYVYPVRLWPDQPDPQRYGWNYAGVKNRRDDVRFLFDGEDGPFRLSLRTGTFYGNRVDVWLNDEPLGTLTQKTVNELYISAADQRPGVNELAVTRSGTGYAWGVRDVRLMRIAESDLPAAEPPPEPPDEPPDDPVVDDLETALVACRPDDPALALGVTDGGVYGSAGSGATIVAPALSLRFNVADAPPPLTLTLDSYDSDAADEIEVLLNGRSLGFLDWAYPQLNNVWNATPDRFDLDAELLRPGCNRLVVRQAQNPRWRWAVRHLRIAPATADTPMVVIESQRDGVLRVRYRGADSADDWVGVYPAGGFAGQQNGGGGYLLAADGAPLLVDGLSATGSVRLDVGGLPPGGYQLRLVDGGYLVLAVAGFELR